METKESMQEDTTCGMNSSVSRADKVPRARRLFDNLPELLKPETVASLLGISIKTIYDWRYRRKLKKVPDHLFLKINRLLYLRTDVLRDWIIAQNPMQQIGRTELIYVG